MGKLNAELRETRTLSDSLGAKVVTLDHEVMTLRVSEKKTEGRLWVYKQSLRDSEYKYKMVRAKYDTISQSSTLIMKRIMAITMRMKRTQVSNEEIMEENERQRAMN